MIKLVQAVLNWILMWFHLIADRQVGWTSLNRKTGKLENEQEPLLKKLKLIILFNPIVEWIDTTHVARLWVHYRNTKAGIEESKPISHNKIKSFIDFYGINMKDFEPSDPEKYPTFEDFFVRKHKESARPVEEFNNPKRATIVADSRVVTYDTVAESKKLWIKGSDFNMATLVMDNMLGARFKDAAVASFRLSPQDCHRYHSPVSGTIKEFRSLPGDYYQVDPIALRTGVNILTKNAREYVVINSPEFGEVLFVAIGATDVGTVQFHNKYQQPGSKIEKGEELGLFQFGGSSILVAFQHGRIKFDDDLRKNSKNCIQVSVEVGMGLGKASQLSSSGSESNGKATKASYAQVIKEE